TRWQLEPARRAFVPADVRLRAPMSFVAGRPRQRDYDGPVAAKGTARVGGMLLALMIGMGSIGLGWLLWPPPGGGHVHAARATVVESVLCGPPNAEDLVHVELLGGRVIPARLDGCGHRLGEVLAVEVPDPVPIG